MKRDTTLCPCLKTGSQGRNPRMGHTVRLVGCFCNALASETSIRQVLRIAFTVKARQTKSMDWAHARPNESKDET